MAYLNVGVLDEFQHVKSVGNGVLPLLGRHDPSPKLLCLIVLALLGLMPIMALAAHNIV